MIWFERRQTYFARFSICFNQLQFVKSHQNFLLTFEEGSRENTTLNYLKHFLYEGKCKEQLHAQITIKFMFKLLPFYEILTH